MTMTRKWSLLTAVLIVGILAAGWFVLVSPKRSDAADLRAQATKQQADNAALTQKLNELKAQSLDLPKKKAELAVFGKEIPNNPALPTLIRDLTAAGKKVGVSVVSMKPGAPAATVAAVPAAPVAAAATTDTGTSAAAETPAAPTAPTAPTSTLYQVPLQLEIGGSYFEVEQFINKLEGMQRKFLLTGFTLKPGGASSDTTGASTAQGHLSLSLTGQVFLAPAVATASATSPSATAPGAAAAQ